MSHLRPPGRPGLRRQGFTYASTLLQAVRRFGPMELGLIAILLLIAGGVGAFLEIAEEVGEGDIRQIDETVLLLFRNPADHADPLGPLWLEEAMRDLTALGSVAVLTTLTLSVAGFLALAGKLRVALFVLVSIGGGVALSFALKHGFDRPRPDLVAHGADVFTASFPSAHASMSAVAYLALGALMARIQPLLRLKIYIVALAVALTLIVGISRVYLGVHWPSDVLAGWTLGSSWALLCWLLALWLQRRGEVERPVGEGV